MAKKLNYSRSTITHYESNTRFPDQKTLCKFADFFDVSLDYLLGRVNLKLPVACTKQNKVENNKDFGKVDEIKKPCCRIIEKIQNINRPYKASHLKKVSDLSQSIGKALQLNKDKINILKISSLLYDIGEIFIPSSIVNKTKKLTKEEFMLIKTHTKKGYNFLLENGFQESIASVALQHHERLDGSGYPAGLKGDKIIFEARIIAVADVFVALTSDRPHRTAYGLTRTLYTINEKAGLLFDKEVVKGLNLIINSSKTPIE